MRRAFARRRWPTCWVRRASRWPARSIRRVPTNSSGLFFLKHRGQAGKWENSWTNRSYRTRMLMQGVLTKKWGSRLGREPRKARFDASVVFTPARRVIHPSFPLRGRWERSAKVTSEPFRLTRLSPHFVNWNAPSQLPMHEARHHLGGLALT